jgi:hypothetical protein
MKKKCCGKYALKGERATESALDKQEQGSHYKNAKIQAIEFITAHKLDFIDGNIVKYAVRKKDGETDNQRYDKIIHYAQLAKELKCG